MDKLVESGTVAALWWVKRDFRLADNPALTRALADHPSGAVLPVFFMEPSVYEIAQDASPMQTGAIAQAVVSLRDRLVRRDSDLLVVGGEVPAALDRLHAAFGFTHLYSHQETGGAVTYSRDKAVARWCRRRGVTWTEVPQQGVARPLRDRDGRDAFWESFMQRTPLPDAPIRSLPSCLRAHCECAWQGEAARLLVCRAQSDDADSERQAVHEPIALATLNGFLERRAARYSGGISSPVTAFTAGSRLSVHLAWGTLTSRLVLHRTQEALRYWRNEEAAGNPEATQWRRGLRAFIERLAWRDHFVQRLEDETGMEFDALHPAYRDLPYVSGAEADQRLAHWVAGTTGFPLVDATMRCLARTGFVNFRMRAMAVSFACHALRLDWRTVHYPLARVFRDYEPGIHLSQVQMQAGVVGINTIRVYSPAKQLREQDPALLFTRRWIPELRDIPDGAVLSGDLSETASEYPPPCIDFAAESKIMKDVLWERKKQYADSPETAAVLARHGSRRNSDRFRANSSRGFTRETTP